MTLPILTLQRSTLLQWSSRLLKYVDEAPLIPLAIVWLILSGCADPIEQRSTQEVREQLQRGVTGQGTLGPLERSPDDPAAQHSVPQTHP